MDKPNKETVPVSSPPRLTRTPPASPAETPRTRARQHGLATLSDRELLTLILRCSGDRIDHLLEVAGSLFELSRLDPAALHYYGLTSGDSIRLGTACELARRLALAAIPPRPSLLSPAAFARYISLNYCAFDQEIAGALFLNSRGRLLAHRELFRGTLSRTSLEPRQILREALLRRAAKVILFHTHPSGDPTPSTEDILITRRMVDAGRVVGVDLLDHIIVAAPFSWISLRDHVLSMRA